MHVRMKYYVSGGRWDGREWPEAGTVIEVPDWEGEDLIRGQHATPADPPPAPHPVPPARHPAPPAPAPHPAAVAPAPQPLPGRPDVSGVPGQDSAAGAQAATGSEAGDHPGEPAGTAAEPSAVADGDPAVAPGPSAPKTAWVQWAVDQGAKPEAAGAMTKIDLMSKYGGRL